MTSEFVVGHTFGTVISLPTPRVAVSLSVTGLVLLILVGASAPNVNTLLVQLPLSVLPSWPAWMTYPMMAAAVVLECLGLAGMLWVRNRGWSPEPWRLYAVGAVFVLVIVNLTPVGSSDPASYAAYGRLAALGYDPYATTPHDALQGTGYYSLISASWQRTPSVYGPVATWIQAAAAQIGGDRPWLTIWVLQIFNGMVFLAVGYLLLRTSEDSVRATLLWTANPLMIQELVGGGHLDTFVAAGSVCALQLVRHSRSLSRDVAAGIVLGVTVGVKIDAGLVALAIAWPLLRDRNWRRLVAIALASVITVVAVYAPYGTHALAPLSSASRLVSVPAVWDLAWFLGRTIIGGTGTSTLICVLWPLVMAYLIWRFGGQMKTVRFEQAAYTSVIVLAWLFAAPWVMPWYAAPGWGALALLPRNPLTRRFAVTTAVLALIHSSGGHTW